MNEELKIIIRAELEQFKKAMKDAVAGIKGVANESRKASKSIDGFTAEVNQQGKALSDLKQKYIDLAKAHGTESKEAKDAAEAIRKLSAEYKTNKALAGDLANKANSFDVSLGGEETSQNVEDINTNMGELQGTMESIKGLNFAEVMVSAFGPAVGKKIQQAKEWFAEAQNFAAMAKSSLSKSGEYYTKYGNDWEGFAGALGNWKANMEEATEASIEGFKKMGGAMKEATKSIGTALKGVVGIALVLVASIGALVVSFKNALTVAKQLKTEAAEASKLGLTTQSYQEWSYVLEQVGVGADKLSDFLKTLADEQNAVRDGSEEIVKAFEDIGLSQEEVAGMDQQTLFNETVKGLQNIENAAERTSIAYRIFGEDAAELANVLYLNNQETQSLIDNYYNLGAAPSDNLINKSKILTGSTTNLSYAWQGLKNTLAEWVIPAVIAVVQWITTAVAYINAFLQGIFGIKNVGKDAGKGTENVGKGIGKIGNNAKKATGAVKELLRYTMGFDELNIIPKQSAGGSGSGDIAGAGGAGYSSAGINPELPVIETPDLSGFRAWMDEYGGIIQGILTWTAILGGIAMIVFGFMGGNIPLILGGAAVVGLGIAIGAAGGEESHWNKLGEGFMNVVRAIGDFVVDAWNSIMGILSTVGSWIYDNVIAPVGNFFKGLWESIKAFFAPAVEWFGELFGSVAATIESIITVIVGLFRGAWEIIKVVWGIVSGWFNDKVIQPVAGFFSSMWDNIKTAAKSAWEGIKAVFTPVVEWFKDKFKKAWEGVKNVFSTGAKIFTGIKEGIADVFKTVVNGIIGGINKIIKVPFDTINKMLNKIRNAEFLGIAPFKDMWKENPLSVPQIPLLAKGGVVDNATLAMIGERGKEAVLPLENNTGWMDILADRINGKNQASRIVLMVDGRELGYAAINSINGITKQTGTLQLQLV